MMRDSRVTGVGVTPDGARIVAGSVDNAVWVLGLFPAGQQLIDQAKKVASRCLTAAQRQPYHLSPVPPRWCHTTKKWSYDAACVVDKQQKL
jgi:hypothetical protein